MPITKVGVDGLTLGISAAAPATQDIAGYVALTYTALDSCAIIDAGVLGDSWSEHEDNTLCTAGAGSVKGKRIFGQSTWQLKYFKGDAVAVLLQAAFDAAAGLVSVEITLTNGDIRYFQAQVSQFDEVFGTTGSDVEATVKFLQQVETVKDGV